MTVFTEAWERQRQLRHHTLLRQLKTELAAHRRATQTLRPAISPTPAPASPSSTPSNSTHSRPKPKPVGSRDLIKTVAIR